MKLKKLFPVVTSMCSMCTMTVNGNAIDAFYCTRNLFTIDDQNISACFKNHDVKFTQVDFTGTDIEQLFHAKIFM